MVSDLNIRISHKPSINQLEQIKEWLKEEDEKFNSGFYCNWNIISDSFYKKSLIIISVDAKVIGFCTYKVTGKRLVTIEIFSITCQYRSLGFGKLFYYQIENTFGKTGFYIITLQCAPAKSEKFWKSNKFIEYPKDEIWESKNKHLYKIIVRTLEKRRNNTQLTNRPVLSIWANEYDFQINTLSTWSWIIRFEKKTNKLLLPIITPINYEWYISFRHNEKLYMAGSIKRCLNSNSDCYGFLIVNEINKYSHELKDNYL